MSYDAVVGVAAVAPGLAGALVGQVSPDAVASTSRVVRGVVAFVLVLGIGVGIRQLGRGYVDESISAIQENPATAVVYGISGYIIVGIVALYGATTLARLSLAGGLLVRAGVVASSVAVLVLTSYGFLVVGTLLIDLVGRRRGVEGVVIGAVLSGLSWALLSLTGSIVSSFAIAAFGIGGSARVWIHSDRTVESEIDGQ